jgi:hypothetical protein
LSNIDYDYLIAKLTLNQIEPIYTKNKEKKARLFCLAQYHHKCSLKLHINYEINIKQKEKKNKENIYLNKFLILNISIFLKNQK